MEVVETWINEHDYANRKATSDEREAYILKKKNQTYAADREERAKEKDARNTAGELKLKDDQTSWWTRVAERGQKQSDGFKSYKVQPDNLMANGYINASA